MSSGALFKLTPYSLRLEKAGGRALGDEPRAILPAIFPSCAGKHEADKFNGKASLRKAIVSETMGIFSLVISAVMSHAGLWMILILI